VRGRKPKPAAVRRREGNAGKRPIVEEALIGSPVFDVPEAPEWLSDRQAYVWNEIMPDLVELGIVRSIDATILESLCVFVAMAREAEETVRDDGFTTTGAQGGIVVHPAFRVMRDSWKEARSIGEQYGLTTTGRLRLGVAALKAKSLAEELREALEGDEEPDVVDGFATEEDEPVTSRPRRARAKALPKGE
jgi:P27 family predicted phage terminase small subunit